MSYLNRESSALWRTVAAALIGIVATGLSAWLLVGQNAIGREEARQMIVEMSPYVADRNAIRETLDANSRLLEKIVLDVQLIKIEQARQGEKIEGIVKSINQREK